MGEHRLKTLDIYFDAVERGEKTFEVRLNDRAFQTGDILILQRWEKDRFSVPYMTVPFRTIRKRVTYLLQGGQFGIEPAYCVLGLGDDEGRSMTDHQSEWVLVKRTAALEHLNAGWRALAEQGLDIEQIELQPVYAAMLEAAPSAPQADQGLVERLRKERDHWKANHDQMVQRNSVLRERPDLPVDRLPAIARYEAQIATLDEQVAALSAKIASLAPHGTCACSYDHPDDLCGHHSPQIATLTSQLERAREAKVGNTFTIKHDGFTGTVQGQYVTREGKRGVVLQQEGTRVVHVYGEKWLKPVPAALQGGEGA